MRFQIDFKHISIRKYENLKKKALKEMLNLIDFYAHIYIVHTHPLVVHNIKI